VAVDDDKIRMSTKSANLLAIAVLLFVSGGLLFAGAPNKSRRSGQVVSATASGHGPAKIAVQKKSQRMINKTDIWWTYCISADGLFYSVISRESPEKTGMSRDKTVKFSERKNQIDIVNPRGKNVALRILRKDKSGKCP